MFHEPKAERLIPKLVFMLVIALGQVPEQKSTLKGVFLRYQEVNKQLSFLLLHWDPTKLLSQAALGQNFTSIPNESGWTRCGTYFTVRPGQHLHGAQLPGCRSPRGTDRLYQSPKDCVWPSSFPCHCIMVEGTIQQEGRTIQKCPAFDKMIQNVFKNYMGV